MAGSQLQLLPSQRADGLQRGYGSFLVLPFNGLDAQLGVLVVYATEPEAFIDPEVAGLSLLARSLAQHASPDKQHSKESSSSQ